MKPFNRFLALPVVLFAMQAHATPLPATKAALLASLPRLAHVPTSAALPAYFLRRADGAADDLLAALAADDVPAQARDAWAWRAWAWGYGESSFLADPPGHNDDGRACGVLQVHANELHEWLPAGWTCAALRKDRVLGWRAGIRIMRRRSQRSRRTERVTPGRLRSSSIE